MTEPHSGNETLLVSLILRIGMFLALLAAIIGTVLFLVQGGPVPVVPAGRLPALFERAVLGSLHLQPDALVELGLIFLLLTPIARVAAGIASSIGAHDRLYALIGTIVLLLVLIGLVSGELAA